MNTYSPPYNITPKILNLISSISEALGYLSVDTAIKIPPLLRKKNRIKTLQGTLEIEGNFLGEEKITAILDGKRVLGTARELAEVRGAIEAYERVDTYRYDNLEDLLFAHKILMREVISSAGSFRDANVKVANHIAPPPYRVAELMNNLFVWLKNSDEHMILKSCIFHYEFEFIHPFLDGNGRIGRLWQSVILAKYNPIFSFLPIESIIREYQQEYYNAIENSTQSGEYTSFIEFMLKIILESLQNIYKSNHKSSYKSNHKTYQILSLMKENATITIKELAEILSMSESGIKKIIKKLKDKGSIHRLGSLKSGYWEVRDDENDEK